MMSTVAITLVSILLKKVALVESCVVSLCFLTRMTGGLVVL